MKHGSLFSGIGGFDLAAQWMGWENVFQVEIDEFCNKVLEKHFPETERYKDIHEFNGEKYRGAVDIISGGFPCQPFSQAGKKQGTKDNRYLWHEMLRVISEVQPSWVVGENVAGILSMENGRTLERILTDLENEGYWVEVFVIPACGVGAWHRRDRVWIISNSKDTRVIRGEWEQTVNAEDGVEGENIRTGSNQYDGCKDVPNTKDKRQTQCFKKQKKGEVATKGACDVQHTDSQYGKEQHISTCGKEQELTDRGFNENATHPNEQGLQGCRPQPGQQKAEPENGIEYGGKTIPNTGGRRQPGSGQPEQPGDTEKTEERQAAEPINGCEQGVRQPESRLGRMVDGFSYWLHEPSGIPRVSKGSKDKRNRLMALGNAIVPQVAYEIFKAIEQMINQQTQIR